MKLNLKDIKNSPLIGEAIGGTIGIGLSVLLGGLITAKAEKDENRIDFDLKSVEAVNEKNDNPQLSE